MSTSLSSRHSASASTSASANTGANAALSNLLASKRAELTSLLALRDLSASLSAQIAALGEKISMLDHGFEGVSTVMENWGAVLRVLEMVGSATAVTGAKGVLSEVKMEGVQTEGSVGAGERVQTVVRIPVDVASISGMVDGDGEGGRDGDGREGV